MLYGIFVAEMNMMRLFVIVVLCMISKGSGFSAETPTLFHEYIVQRTSAVEFHNALLTPGYDSVTVETPETIVGNIERAIVAEDAKGVAQYFGKQVFLSLQNSEGSYYSSNQAQYVLQDFFTSHRVIAFKFTSVNATASTSYATGGGRIKLKGNRAAIQVYISLTKAGDRWVISQFNVY
jgi:hypothetical protein